jgi:hypothetical protein
MEEVSGYGHAELLDDGAIEIMFAYHNGDEAVLKAKRDTSSTSCYMAFAHNSSSAAKGTACGSVKREITGINPAND